jgi:probable Rubsico expression protein CbbX
MMGLTWKNFKISMLLLVITIAIAVTWNYLPHLWAAVVTFTAVGVALLALVTRNSWRQTSRAEPYPETDFSAVPLTVLASTRRRRNGAPGSQKRAPGSQKGTPGSRDGGRKRDQFRVAADARARRRGEALHPDAAVTLSDERQAAGIDDVFTSLNNELVGLLPVKKKVEEIASLLLVDRVRQRFGLMAPRPNLHMCFTGAPGTGKTTVALKMADLLYRLGYIEKPHLVHAMRDDLVGEYIGQTAPKTKRVLERAMGGVLFIDEAYYLYRASDSRDFGQECIDILLQVMENDRDKLVVILAGYQDRMDEFFSSNPGMSSRIAHHLDFAPYQLDELVAIGRTMLDRAYYYLSDDAEAAFRDYLTLRMRQPRFANARSVRNELERARLRHAYRLANDPELRRSKDDLMRIEPADILSSPVFSIAALPDIEEQLTGTEVNQELR